MKYKLAKFALIMFAATILCTLVAYNWPNASYDIEQVHPRLRALEEPLQYAASVYYLDGGSVAMHFIDAKGKHFRLVLPIHDEEANGRVIFTYREIEFDVLSPRTSKLPNVPLTDADWRFLIDMLDRYGDPSLAFFGYYDGPRELRGSFRDHVRARWYFLRARLFGKDEAAEESAHEMWNS